MTMNVKRAYTIADNFRKRKRKVIMGGHHCMAMPEEAAQHADSIVTCEAELIWDELWNDLSNNQLKPFYKSNSFIESDQFANFDYPLILNEKYKYPTKNILYTTRGCPFKCDFCSVTEFFGHKFRFRPISHVIETVEYLKINNPHAAFYSFLDDNIIGNPVYAKELFKRLIPLKINWISQGSVNITDDDELIDLAAASGCRSLFVGIESINKKALESMNKKQNKIEYYYKLISKLQNKGIVVIGGLIFGTDEDDESVFEDTIQFVQDTGIAFPFISMYTPLPGTFLYRRLMEEKRITNFDWDLYDMKNCVISPNKMDAKTLVDGYNYSLDYCYAEENMKKRLEKMSTKTRIIAQTFLKQLSNG
jgi:radical SAM superfamily enzyme YgiQ (UPF0313 family)